MIEELISDVQKRNAVRREVGLPLLSVPQEVRKIYQARRLANFEQFAATTPLRQKIANEVLTNIRALRRNPTWKPTGMLSGGGLAFHLEVRRRLRQHYDINGG